MISKAPMIRWWCWWCYCCLLLIMIIFMMMMMVGSCKLAAAALVVDCRLFMGQTGVDGCGPLCCGCDGGAVGDEGVRCVYTRRSEVGWGAMAMVLLYSTTGGARARVVGWMHGRPWCGCCFGGQVSCHAYLHDAGLLPNSGQIF